MWVTLGSLETFDSKYPIECTVIKGLWVQCCKILGLKLDIWTQHNDVPTRNEGWNIFQHKSSTSLMKTFNIWQKLFRNIFYIIENLCVSSKQRPRWGSIYSILYICTANVALTPSFSLNKWQHLPELAVSLLLVSPKWNTFSLPIIAFEPGAILVLNVVLPDPSLFVLQAFEGISQKVTSRCKAYFYPPSCLKVRLCLMTCLYRF